jgi:carbon-monoxide dehydrogenase medium subunit
MSNSRVITTDFKYFAPASLEEALELMNKHNPRPLAGGTDLLNGIKTEGMAPEALLYTLTIEGLDAITCEKELAIGGAAGLSDIEYFPEVGAQFPALKEAINVIGGIQIRNMGTLVGNLCNASPGADTPPILIALDAEVEISSAAGDGSVSARTISLEELYAGPKKTTLDSGELVTKVKVPIPPPGSGQSFRRLARVKLDIAKINCGVVLRRKGDTIQDIRIAFGSVAPTPVRALQTEALLKGKPFNVQTAAAAAAAIGKDISPIDDVRSTAEYRNHAAGILLKEALDEAWNRAGGE